MKKAMIFLGAAVFAFVLSGCGGDWNGDRGTTPQVFVSEILSDSRVDGYISEDVLLTRTLFPALTTGFINVGIDRFTLTEHRGFLHFPLVGNVPDGAIVSYAFVEFFVNAIQDPPVPILVDMVEFLPPLRTSYFFNGPSPFLPSIATQGPFPVPFSAALGPPFRIDVTSLVQLAIDRRDTTFQIRLLLDLFTATGTIQIDDAAAATAPLLHVEYF